MSNKIIKIDDIEGKIYELENWKPSHSDSARNYFLEKINNLKIEYRNLIDEFDVNNMIYNSKIAFKPIMGKKYYLYKNNKNKSFLSLISPDEWEYDTKISFLGAFKQDIHLKWTPVSN